MADVVYALHDFDAENPDELSFGAGEVIVVLERDGQYGDGWFSGRNTHGEIGLFPQSYTSPSPPSPPLSPTSPSLDDPAPADPVLVATMSDVQQALDQLTVDQDSRADSLSVRSHLSDNARGSDDEDAVPRENLRAVLAAKAAANAEKEALEEREREERRRREDEEAYARTRRENGLVEGLQLSDESEDEEDGSGQGVAQLSGVGSSAAPASFSNALDTPSLSTPAKRSVENRPRADTTTSIYPESIDSSSPPPLPLLSVAHDSGDHVGQQFDSVAPAATGDKSSPKAAGAVVAGIAGVAGAAAFVASSSTREPSLPPSDPSPPASTTPIVFPDTATAPLLASFSPKPPAPAPLRAVTEQATSPPASLPSANQSRSSSRFERAPLTADTSPPESTEGPGNASGKDLPYDPRTWVVEDVLEWGIQKGFDALTLSKFKEHEISGDILIEMDVAMLKEIDLAAFGRRVHIYNAIKELKARISRPSSMVSPPLSGFESDSPGRISTMASPYGYSPSMFSDGDARTGKRASDASQAQTRGLGIDEDAAMMRSAMADTSAAVFPRNSVDSPGHARSATGESLSVDAIVDAPIPEEEEEENPAADPAPSSASLLSTPVFPTPPTSTRPHDSISYSSNPAVSVKSSKRSTPASSSVLSSPNTSRSKPKAERSFFGATLGRSRKPPPRLPSSLDLGGKTGTRDLKSSTRSRASVDSIVHKRSTRLFGSFGSNDKGAEARRKTSASSNPGSPREGLSSMSPKEVDVATSEMHKVQPAVVTSGNLLERIGTPDYSGWMQKKGETRGWKQRFFVLKGVHLYYLKSENEQKVKGFINLDGYRVLADADIHVGEFGFKIVHRVDRTHYFSAAEQVTVRSWMKEIMKATIGRDYSAPVVSSCDVDTMPLKIAQSMNPRPPSPASRARVQRERHAGSNPNTLTPSDAQKLMEFSPGSPIMASSPASKRASPLLAPSESFVSRTAGLLTRRPKSIARSISGSSAVTPTADSSSHSELLDWVNSNLPASTAKASDLGTSMRSGEILVRLAEKLSGDNSGMDDAAFAKYRPGTGEHVVEYFDVVFAVFDFLTPLVSTDEISMDDMLSGNEEQMIILIERIRTKFAA